MPGVAAGGKAPRHAIFGDGLRRGGMVMAATPATTQARPIHAVGDSRSPSNVTLSATPIGTRR